MRLPRGRAGRGGGLGLGAIVLILVGAWALGIDPSVLLGGGSRQLTEGAGPRSPEQERLADFVGVILADTEKTWAAVFAAESDSYRDPRLVLFSGGVSSACGFAGSATGPFYCPGDSRVYIDLSFYQRLEGELGAPGDFAQAYVLAHEVGHHVQNLIGVLPEYHRARQGLGEAEANALSVRVELQADCFAGLWAHYAARQTDFLEPGDLEEGLNAASRIGDDTLQRRAQGYVVPESFNHGTSEQRVRWFRRGFEVGRIEACDTLGSERL